MALHIHHSSHLVPLVDALAAVLAEPLADPFTTEVVAVPTAGVRDWLQQELAFRLGTGDQLLDHRAGVCANIEMVYPGRFTAAVLGHDLRETSPWDLERLTWSVLGALHSGAVAVPGWNNRDGRPGRQHGLSGTYVSARSIADLFDRYATNRPQMLQQWALGHDGDGTLDEHDAVVPVHPDHRWQPALWRSVREQIGIANPAELLPGLLEALTAGRIEPALPSRVAVFGLSTTSTAQITILRALAEVREVHLHLVHPSPGAWSSSPHRLAGRLALRSSCDAAAAVRHPLLRSWGRPAMEATALVAGLAEPTRTIGHDDGRQTSFPGRPALAPPSTLLKAIQRGIIDDEPPQALGHDSGDASLQIHACHGTLRQLEVLRDALGHALDADPSLAATDIVVLCPDLQRFAAQIPSVFRRSSLPIAVRVTDLSLGTDNPVAVALLDTLAALGGRCTGPEIHALCRLAPVRATFGFDDVGIERIGTWINDLGVTWGTGTEHRSRWIPDTIAEGTWSATLDRLLLGAAMPAPQPRVGPDGIVPFDDVDAGALVTAGQLAELIGRLDQIRITAESAHPIDAWIAILTQLVDGLLTADGDDAWQRIEVMDAIAAFGDRAGSAPSVAAVPLVLGDVVALLTDALDDQRGRLNLRSGSVTVTAMVPVRNLPARVVCVLGLDDAALRSTGVDGDDLLGVRPCIGERDPRTEGRHLLLDALMTASDHLLITCDGSDITTNRPLPLPVLVAELLDTATAIRPGHCIVRRHPRHAYDERNYGVAPDGSAITPFSFDFAMLSAATQRRVPISPAAASPLLSPVVPTVVSIDELADSVTRPAKTFLGRRLEARLPRPVEEVETDIPLVAGSLAMWSLAAELLDHHRVGRSETEIAQWRAARRSGGTLPPRALADAVLDEVESGVTQLIAVLDDPSVLARSTARVDIAIGLETDVGATIELRHTVTGIEGNRIIRVDFRRPKERDRIRAALELAAAIIAEPDTPWRSIVVLRPASGRSNPTVHDLQPDDPTGPETVAAARRLLELAVNIHMRALREPIPMFDRCAGSLYADGTIDDDEFARELGDTDTGFLWGDTSAEDVLALPVRDHDPVEVLATAAASERTGRAVALARTLWGAFHDLVGASGR